MGINIRQKGAEGERQVAKALNAVLLDVLSRQDWTPEAIAACKNCIQRNQNQSAVGGNDLNNVFGLGIEIKRQEQLSVNTWWTQCVQGASRNGEFPVLVYRQNNRPWNVVMYGSLALPRYNEGAGSAAFNSRTARVTIEWDDFLAWFGLWVERKLANGEYPRV
jgi:hypothetical protein